MRWKLNIFCVRRYQQHSFVAIYVCINGRGIVENMKSVTHNVDIGYPTFYKSSIQLGERSKLKITIKGICITFL